MNLVQRVQDILLRPKATWPQIDREPATVGGLYTQYLVVLAAISALCSFVGLSIVGVGGMGVNFRVPFFAGLMNMVVGFVLTLVAVYVLALIVDALAPTFQGRKDPISALKLVVYASTAGLLGGIFNLVPALGVLGLLAALYSIYLIYTGLPVLMKCPQEKAVAYTAVVVVCGIVVGVIIGTLASLTLPGQRMGGLAGAGGSQVTVSMPGGEVTVDTTKMEAYGRKLEEAGKRVEQAQKSGDAEAVGKATQDMMAAVLGGAGVAYPASDLKALLPESVAGLKRESIESQGGQAMGIAGTSARATYAAGERHLELSISDLGAMARVATAGWASGTSDRETEDEIEKTWREGKRTLRQEARKDGSSSSLTILLANGVVVQAHGQQFDATALKAAVDSLGLDRIEAMPRPAKS